MTHYDTTCPRCGNKGDVCLDMDIGGMWQVGCNLCGHPVRLKKKPKEGVEKVAFDKDAPEEPKQGVKGVEFDGGSYHLTVASKYISDRTVSIPKDIANALYEFISKERDADFNFRMATWGGCVPEKPKCDQQVGVCPHCGAPIYQWLGTGVNYTCDCRFTVMANIMAHRPKERE